MRGFHAPADCPCSLFPKVNAFVHVLHLKRHMMAYTVLYIILIVMIAVFAIVFICYRSRTDQPASVQPSDMQAAAIMYSRRGFAPSLVITRPHQRYYRYSGKVPTPPTIISNLPCMNYEAPSQSSTDAKDTLPEDELPQCVICCCAFEEQEKVKLLPCLHMYHEECIDAWLQRDHICPICQADVILAAGLSLGTDWSVHTLEAVNTVSGAARPQTAAAAAGSGSNAVSAAAAGHHHADVTAAAAPTAVDRPSTAPAGLSRQGLQQQQQQQQQQQAAAEVHCRIEAAQAAQAVQMTAQQCSVNRASSGSRHMSSRADAANPEHVVLTIRPMTAGGTSTGYV